MVTLQCSKYLRKGSLSTSEEENKKRKIKKTIRYGYDDINEEFSDTSNDTETSLSSSPSQKRRRPNHMKRQSAVMTFQDFPSVPSGNFLASSPTQSNTTADTSKAKSVVPSKPEATFLASSPRQSCATTETPKTKAAPLSEPEPLLLASSPTLPHATAETAKSKSAPASALESSFLPSSSPFQFQNNISFSASQSDNDTTTRVNSTALEDHSQSSTVVESVPVFTEVKGSCHCEHMAHWVKQIMVAVFRVEQYLHRSGFKVSGQTAADETLNENYEPSNRTFATTNEDLQSIFEELSIVSEKRRMMLKSLVKEVSNNEKDSIRHVLLRIAPPDVWMQYSKNGQRGKLSAMKLGVPEFLIDCLNLSKVSKSNFVSRYYK